MNREPSWALEEIESPAQRCENHFAVRTTVSSNHMPVIRQATVRTVLALTTLIAIGHRRTLIVRSAADTPGIPPLSYVCPMPKDADVVEDKPGKCRKCGMELKAVRLDTAYSCPRHPAVILGQTGMCPIDHQPLVKITASLFWTCGGEPNTHELSPGLCSNGQARVKAYERRAHGDHNPRHGGQFFMADDNWHHLEGTHPARDVFRLYFYDDYTRPMTAKGFVGEALLLDAADRTIGSVPLTLGRDRSTLQARISPVQGVLRIKAKVRFAGDDRERGFDFAFPDLTHEPVVAVGSANARDGMSVSATTPNARSVDVRNSPAIAPAGSVQGDAGASANPVLSNAPLPQSIPELVAELRRDRQDIETQIRGGYLGGVWWPAMRSKDIALALQEQAANLSAPDRLIVEDAIKQLVLAAWQIDAAGDLGDKQKIADAYVPFSSAVDTIVGAYAGR